MDCETKETLPFANVLSIQNKTGTATNFEGNFYLETTTDDSLRITFIGYEQKFISVKELIAVKQICLSPKSVNIEQVVISASSNFLYDLVAGCRKNRFTEELTAKTHFLLKSEINNQQVELVEAYYNGTYQNHDIQRLDLKNGRIYLSKFENNSYVSMGTSTGINLHKTFDFNLYFPGSPLEWSELKLKKKFDLSFVEKFTENSETIYVIDFKERNEEGKFHGRLWLDSTNQLLKKVQLQNEEGANSPFLAVGNADQIKAINFDITKTFHLVDGKNTVKSIDFNYTLIYLRKNKEEVTVNTKAALFAYDYKNLFVLPYFEKDYRLNDYQGINLAPYNKTYWDNNREFKLMANESEKRLFIESNTTNLIDSFSYDPITRQIASASRPIVNGL